MRRVLQVGYGRIGQPIHADYSQRLEVMVVDPAVSGLPNPWDGEPVDLAYIVVDTPGLDGGRFDYGCLFAALRQYVPVSDFVVVRSTVGLDFLTSLAYLAHGDQIGFAPEFYGATERSRRGAIDLGFSMFSHDVPDWFVELAGTGTILRGAPAEVIVAKLAENAYLATKVTFFHELFLLCQRHDLDFESVRELVTADPRIGHHHTACDGHVGWSSHCFDKDVPVYAAHAGPGLVAAMLHVNREMLDR